MMENVASKVFPRADTLIVKERIGRGGYAEVFRGTLGSRPVAIKKIYDILIDAARENRQDLEYVIREFHRECDLLKAAKHPNVVEFIGTFYLEQGEESAVLVMELMERTLEQFLRDNRGTLSREKQIGICLLVASGLQFLHQHDPQILHRDLTTKNVLMTKDGTIAKISDFGQAKYRPSSAHYLTSRQPGTVLYMPPEALIDKPYFTDKGDVFSLGVLMLQVATQEPPSCGLVIRGQPEVERRAADLAKVPTSHPLRPIILQCLQDNPAKRPSCSEVWKKLRGFQATTQGSSAAQQEAVKREADKISKEVRKVSTGKTKEGAAWKPKTVVVAKYQFKGAVQHDLPFEKGDLLTIIRASQDPNWYKARREDGLEGMVPANFLQESQPISRAKVHFHKMDWFHGKIGREDAEALLNPKRNGLYLVRESTKFPGDYILCVCYNNTIQHYHIKYKDNEYTIDNEETFENLTQMVEHYQKDADGLVTRLKVPLEKKSGKVEYSVNSEDFKKNGWHIPRKKLAVGSTLSKGQYGEMYFGEYDGKKVTIKSHVNGRLQRFLAEAAVMTDLSHQHLVGLIGVSLDEKPPFIVTEFMKKGSLSRYLRSCKQGKVVIQKQDQLGFARDIADGMTYLEHKDLIHRDLTAQNIFISGKNTAKVSNFELVWDGTFSCAECKLPIKWTAPEVFMDDDFSNKSDVWSFGIVLWEVFSCGRVPYPGIPVRDVVNLINKGERLERPEHCPQEIYAIMKSCWQESPRDRPMFKQLLEQLTKLVQSV